MQVELRLSITREINVSKLHVLLIICADTITVELDNVYTGRIRGHECHDKSNRGSSYRDGLAVSTGATSIIIRHTIHYDRYV
jgi:hypothetical protein